MKTDRQSSRTGWLFSVPFLLNLFVLFAIPLVWAVWLAGTDWNLMSLSWNWVGLANLKTALRDANVHKVFVNGLKYLVAIVPLVCVIGMLVAEVLHHLPSQVKGIFSVIFFIPYLTSGVATSVFVRYFLSYSSSLNVWLRTRFGLTVQWFTNPHTAFWVIVFIIVWKVSGYYALFLFSSLESIPPEIGEAAEIDGATGLKRFFKVTLPMIASSMQSVIMLATGLVYSIFSEPYLLTGGGPQKATLSWQLLLYNTSFVGFRSGYGAMIAILLGLCIFVTLRIVVGVTNRFVDVER
ncbi:MAG: sugar ABC transporter permease [Sphaerochaeta sp.]|jgi:multiple sugar transport system permease protein|nr:sugar ABC transporter permease [Sphaerochaeta sp.]MCH3908688.1 sugar ABC transporter permease [Sphaerochaeta sp.]MCH3920176.1 sugar ABC transporter permease [Sphaerochaeta sp.]MCI2045741.1 sugar ABC transporter permease [Sphaerochaeta sp.]MCI2076947.1 sugar ABC transporter permease [Sphaerochaeta sp.]